MYFTEEQLAAMAALAFGMAKADGQITDAEGNMIQVELFRHTTRISSNKISAAIDDMQKSLYILNAMNERQKKYVIGFLASVMIIDGREDAAEKRFLQLCSTMFGLPNLDVRDAMKCWSELNA